MKILYFLILVTIAAVAVKLISGVTEAQQLSAFQKKSHVLVQLVAYLNNHGLKEADRSKESVIQEFCERVGGNWNEKFLRGVVVHNIPYSQQMGELTGIDYYIEWDGVAVLANGLMFKLPFDAVALAQRNHMRKTF